LSRHSLPMLRPTLKVKVFRSRLVLRLNPPSIVQYGVGSKPNQVLTPWSRFEIAGTNGYTLLTSVFMPPSQRTARHIGLLSPCRKVTLMRLMSLGNLRVGFL
jgi:hypothetical protein